MTLIDEAYGNYNSIWDKWITFIDVRSTHYDITAYNIETKEWRAVTYDQEAQITPRIQGSKIVYSDLRYGDNDTLGTLKNAAIFVYDMETKERKQITNAKWICLYPDIWNEIVVWMDYRDSTDPNNAQAFDGVQIWGYNLNTGKEFQITNLPSTAWPERPKEHPRIWGYKVYVDMMTKTQGIENAIYQFDLPEGAR
ncbi:MAG: hypothetical protein PHU25_11705 [Deltaproteobacteria bacterium]|nr:hypothetical protein [Deltaproteobacteria bacterium]